MTGYNAETVGQTGDPQATQDIDQGARCMEIKTGELAIFKIIIANDSIDDNECLLLCHGIFGFFHLPKIIKLLAVCIMSFIIDCQHVHELFYTIVDP